MNATQDTICQMQNVTGNLVAIALEGFLGFSLFAVYCAAVGVVLVLQGMLRLMVMKCMITVKLTIIIIPLVLTKTITEERCRI
jgi:cation transporter-like permease